MAEDVQARRHGERARTFAQKGDIRHPTRVINVPPLLENSEVGLECRHRYTIQASAYQASSRKSLDTHVSSVYCIQPWVNSGVNHSIYHLTDCFTPTVLV